MPGPCALAAGGTGSLCLSDNVPVSGIWSWANEFSEPDPAEHVRGRRRDDEATGDIQGGEGVIRKAEERDIAAVERHYDELLTYEEKHGSRTNWKRGVYPTRSVAEKGVEKGELFVMEEDGEIRASMILNHVQLQEYAAIPWLHEAEPDKVLVIHTLCVPPSQAGRGTGSRMVRFALEEAERRGCEVMRIDTWEHNEPAAALYRRLGFRHAGKTAVLFEGVIAEHLIFLEKLI